MKLHNILNRAYPDSPIMQLAARRFRIKLLRESREPLAGAYYWYPKPTKDKQSVTWDIIEFYDKHYDEQTMHEERWPEVLELLAHHWKKDPSQLKQQLRDHYSGLPRGRVSKTPEAFILVHGNDGPGPIESVLRVFNLTSLKGTTRLKVLFDIHEQMASGDPEAVQSALGVDLGLKSAKIQLEV